MKDRVETFEEEYNLNAWLEEKKAIKVIDIKFQSTWMADENYSVGGFTKILFMVHYEENM